MDLNNSVILINLFAPLVFALFLIVKKFTLSYVLKTTLKTCPIVISAFNLLYFAICKILSIECDLFYNIFLYEDIDINLGITLNNNNVDILIYSSIVFLVLSFFAKLYFERKKNFMLTCQRFYIFLSLLQFFTYAFIISPNLFQGALFWFVGGLSFLIFSYFDIFKVGISYNPNRFYRIILLGDCAILAALLIFFKYAVLSQGYIENTTLNYFGLEGLSSYLWGLCGKLEFNLLIISLVTACFSRFAIFPLSPLFSFQAGASGMFYLMSVLVLPIFGLGFFINIIPIFELEAEFIPLFKIFLIFALALNLIFVFFEKNFRIIFGYIFSILSSLFVWFYIDLKSSLIITLYFILNLLFAFLLFLLILNDKSSLKRRIIPARAGFITEKIHIFFFERLPKGICNALNFVDEFVISSVISFFAKLSYEIIECTKVNKNNVLKNIKNIIIVIALFILIAIFIALFGSFGEVLS